MFDEAATTGAGSAERERPSGATAIAAPNSRPHILSSICSVVAELRRSAQRSDVMVVAAAMTCYAVFGLVPLLAIATRVASGVFGTGRVTRAAHDLAAFLKGPLGLGDEVVQFSHAAATTSWWTVLLALLPVSLYAEGTVRSLERFSLARERHSRVLRGRLLTPVLILLATGFVLIGVGPVRPLLENPFGRGTGARLIGILVGFNLLFFAVFVSLLLVYRLFASTPIRRGPLSVGAFVAASWIAGQLLGYTLALRLISGFDNAFGTFAPAGEVAALAFLIYLEHLVFVLGYLLALVLHERPPRSRRSDRVGDNRGGNRNERQTATRMSRSADEKEAARE